MAAATTYSGTGRSIPGSWCEAACRRSLAPNIHHHKLAPVEETNAISARLQRLTGDFQRNFVQQIGLILLLDCRRVAGAVHHSRENIKIVGEVHPAPVAEFHRSTLTPAEATFPENFRSHVRCLEDNF